MSRAVASDFLWDCKQCSISFLHWLPLKLSTLALFCGCALCFLVYEVGLLLFLCRHEGVHYVVIHHIQRLFRDLFWTFTDLDLLYLHLTFTSLSFLSWPLLSLLFFSHLPLLTTHTHTPLISHHLFPPHLNSPLPTSSLLPSRLLTFSHLPHLSSPPLTYSPFTSPLLSSTQQYAATPVPSLSVNLRMNETSLMERDWVCVCVCLCVCVCVCVCASHRYRFIYTQIYSRFIYTQIETAVACWIK